MEKIKSMSHHILSPADILRRALLPSLLLGSFPIAAQLHEQINVEGRYVPEIIKAEKINAFPKALDLTLTTPSLPYEGEGVAAAFSPVLMPLPATGWRATRAIDHKRGYLELGTGSWLNSTLSAGYRFVDNSSTLFGIRLQHNSTSLWKPEMSEATADVKQWRYDESVGLYASHVFRGAGRLDAAIDYHVGVFNYYGWLNPSALPGEKLNAPTQTLNDVSAKVDWRSRLSPEPSFSYALSAGVRHFAFRALPIPSLWNGTEDKGARETDVKLAGTVRMPWDNGSSIGLDAKFDLLLYGGQESTLLYDGNPTNPSVSLVRPNKYALLTLTPYYRFTRGLLDIKLGADVDIAVRAGEPGSRYSLFHFAPEVRFAMQTGQTGVFLNVLGGTTLNTLAALHERDYYMMPTLLSTRPTYTPLDATFGVNLGPFSGFSLGVYGAFRVSRNVPLGGWYTAWMDYGTNPIPGMGDLSQPGERLLYSLDKDGINMHGFSVGARMEYTPLRILSLQANASYQPQKGEKGYFNGYDRPRVTADAHVSVSPLAPLRLSLGYDYRGVRNIYTRADGGVPSVSINGGGKSRFMEMRLPDLCLLNFGANWDFNPNFSVWVQADNILNRHDDVLPLQPAQGLTLTAGVKLLF
ncbi:MAG: hypothetical protein K2K64_04275 [Muribaculaceae bacterium]|nr:hypothetical protein [Muribaculaceae bacterium]